MFRNPHAEDTPQRIELIRSTEDEKQSQLRRLREFHKKNSSDCAAMLGRLQQAVIQNENVFAVLMALVAISVAMFAEVARAGFKIKF